MGNIIRQLRNKWRGYLLWGILWVVVFTPLVIAMSLIGQHDREANQKYVVELRKLANQIPVYPGFERSGEWVVVKESRVSLFTYYRSPARLEQIKGVLRQSTN